MYDINHLAIIMDGNARWAIKNNKTKAQGHTKGAEALKKILPSVKDLGIKYLTLYAFSSENWKRPEDEVSTLIGLLSYYLENELSLFQKNQIRLKVIGELSKLPLNIQDKINNAVKSTKDFSDLTVAIAFSYGGREEIVSACNKAILSGEKNISEEKFQNFLYDSEMPDVDLLIRTSGEHRISNFLLWQLAYAELYFIEKLWPDFNIEDLKEAIENYSKRKRNFGQRNL